MKFSEMSYAQRALAVIGVVLLAAVAMLLAAIVIGLLALAAKAIWIAALA